MMFWQKSKTMQYASEKCSLYRSVCLLTGGKESVFLLFQKPKILPHNSHEHKKKTRKHFSKLISSFRKQMRRGIISFPKRKNKKHTYMQMHSIFSNFSNISKPNLKLPFFYLYFDWDSSKCMRDERS